MVCPVCGKKSERMLCPECGFDSCRDYEKYPTLAPVGKTPSVSALRKAWQDPDRPAEKPKKKRTWLAVAACAAALVLGIGIGGEKPGPTEPEETLQVQTPPETTEAAIPLETQPEEGPWSVNVLRSDEVLFDRNAASSCSVFKSKYRRSEIQSVTFVDTLADAPEDAWDVSETGNCAVMAWVKPNGRLYDLYIGAEGGVWAGESCHELFCGYIYAEQFCFANAFHTEGVQDMSYMFDSCVTLTSLDLSNFDTANVQDMSHMFDSCYALTSLDLSSFDISNVQNMQHMFYWCTSLTSLDLSRFDTKNVQDMSDMFDNCYALTSLDLSSFDTSNVQDMSRMFKCCRGLTSLDLSSFQTGNVQDMEQMFYDCQRLTYLDLSSFDTSYVQDMSYMFDGCPAGDEWQHLLK